MVNVNDIISSIKELENEKEEELKKLRMENFNLQQQLQKAQDEAERWKSIAFQPK